MKYLNLELNNVNDITNIIEINPDNKYQSIEGFGDTFTEYGIYILSILDYETRKSA